MPTPVLKFYYSHEEGQPFSIFIIWAVYLLSVLAKHRTLIYECPVFINLFILEGVTEKNVILNEERYKMSGDLMKAPQLDMLSDMNAELRALSGCAGSRSSVGKEDEPEEDSKEVLALRKGLTASK